MVGGGSCAPAWREWSTLSALPGEGKVDFMESEQPAVARKLVWSTPSRVDLATRSTYGGPIPYPIESFTPNVASCTPGGGPGES